MYRYLQLLDKILNDSDSLWKESRPGIKCLSYTGMQFEHDMSDGFPLLTTKKMGIKSISAELEFFIKGLRDKKWLQDRNCKIWDHWANPMLVDEKMNRYIRSKTKTPSISELDATRKGYQKNIKDLGRIYGVQWRDWTKRTITTASEIDQFKKMINTLKEKPYDRGMVVSAWRPDEFDEMALRPCHYAFQVLSDGYYLDLIWIQRSCDFPIGIPYNIASYGILLLLIAKECGLRPRKLIGQFADCHIYEDQIELVKEQLKREPYDLPTLKILDRNGKFDIFQWQYTDIKLSNYKCHDKINYPVSV